MKWSKQLDALKIILGAKIFNKKIPLAVRWQLTDRCPSECKYCKIWKASLSQELPTKKILEILDEIAMCGTKKVSFSGGEPLLRDDIGEIIRYCKKKDISPEMNSTGFLLDKKVNEIKDLDLLKLSLDGPEDIHDSVRGKKGAYEWVIKAAGSAKANNIDFIFTTTLTKFNINYIDYILNLAKEFNTLVAFQPLKEINYFNIKTGNMDSIAPEQEVFKEHMDKLIYYKKTEKKLLRNSMRGLNHIYNWPHYRKLNCWGGKIFCMIAANGEVSPCDRLRYDNTLPNCAEIGFLNAFNRLPPLPPCLGCGFCGTLELNYLMLFKFDLSTMIKNN